MSSVPCCTASTTAGFSWKSQVCHASCATAEARSGDSAAPSSSSSRAESTERSRLESSASTARARSAKGAPVLVVRSMFCERTSSTVPSGIVRRTSSALTVVCVVQDEPSRAPARPPLPRPTAAKSTAAVAVKAPAKQSAARNACSTAARLISGAAPQAAGATLRACRNASMASPKRPICISTWPRPESAPKCRGSSCSTRRMLSRDAACSPLWYCTVASLFQASAYSGSSSAARRKRRSAASRSRARMLWTPACSTSATSGSS
mmetsp:Transcript_9046/g.28227  ORF Transcript_9046/g.28227 Transcript_9046/m.28227 type:complete len:264 (-) Transcript_9046:209-1000(-)